jgi:peptide-methionine (R)-S-oxide reductase
MTMARRRDLFGLLGLGVVGGGLLSLRSHSAKASATVYPVSHTDAEWRTMLAPAAYTVLRQQGTEAPFSSPLDMETRKGTYACAGCTQAAYSSATKYDSQTGWPSFWQPLPKAIAETVDNSFGMQRTEVHCSNCGGHLGHVFPDGPKPTGLRYCMNGAALTFTAA